MKKQLFCIATMTVLLIGFNSITDEKKSQASDEFSIIENSFQFPENNSYFLRHTINIHTDKNTQPISELKIIVPKGLTVKNDITVHKKTGEKIKVKTIIDDQTITLSFPESISPNTELQIDLNAVVISGISNQWLYRIYGKFIGIEPEINLGVARIRTYQ